MLLNRKALATAAAAAGIAALGFVAAPRLRAAVKAALVEVVAPHAPFSATVTTHGGWDATLGVAGNGKLAITSITMTNSNAVAHKIFIFQAHLLGGNTCGWSGVGDTGVVGLMPPMFTYQVPAHSTVHLALPSPWVIRDHPCISAETQADSGATGNIDVAVTGYGVDY